MTPDVETPEKEAQERVMFAEKKREFSFSSQHNIDASEDDFSTPTKNLNIESFRSAKARHVDQFLHRQRTPESVYSNLSQDEKDSIYKETLHQKKLLITQLKEINKDIRFLKGKESNMIRGFRSKYAARRNIKSRAASKSPKINTSRSKRNPQLEESCYFDEQKLMECMEEEGFKYL